MKNLLIVAECNQKHHIHELTATFVLLYASNCMEYNAALSKTVVLRVL